MPYKTKGKCVYKKDTDKKVGCTKGSTKKYLGALRANTNEGWDSTISDLGGIEREGASSQTLADQAASMTKENLSRKRLQEIVREELSALIEEGEWGQSPSGNPGDLCDYKNTGGG